MERYYQPEIETASLEQIKAWQDERLVKQVKNVWDNVPYYRAKMEKAGVTPDDIKGTEDFAFCKDSTNSINSFYVTGNIGSDGEFIFKPTYN